MMLCVDERKNQLIELLQQLMHDSKSRPFLFRTRFERTMIKAQALAKATKDWNLECCATDALMKMRSIVDKSNNTSDGVLLSYTILKDDINNLLDIIHTTN